MRTMAQKRIYDHLMVLHSSICHHRDLAETQAVKEAYNDCLHIIFTDVHIGRSGVWLMRHVRNNCLFAIEMKSVGMDEGREQAVKDAYRSVYESLVRTINQ